MTCFAYILYSQKRQRFYVGVANDIADRLKRHNNAESLSTKPLFYFFYFLSLKNFIKITIVPVINK